MRARLGGVWSNFGPLAHLDVGKLPRGGRRTDAKPRHYPETKAVSATLWNCGAKGGCAKSLAVDVVCITCDVVGALAGSVRVADCSAQ